jgi:hypothetical protein
MNLFASLYSSSVRDTFFSSILSILYGPVFGVLSTDDTPGERVSDQPKILFGWADTWVQFHVLISAVCLFVF